MVMISKGNIEEGNSGIVSLHPGWNILDMNGEFKDSWILKIKNAIEYSIAFSVIHILDICLITLW